MRLHGPNPSEVEARRRVLAAIGEGRLSGFEVALALNSGRDESALYPTLYRLEADGHLQAAWVASAPGGRRRRYARTR